MVTYEHGHTKHTEPIDSHSKAHATLLKSILAAAIRTSAVQKRARDVCSGVQNLCLRAKELPNRTIDGEYHKTVKTAQPASADFVGEPDMGQKLGELWEEIEGQIRKRAEDALAGDHEIEETFSWVHRILHA